jgi:hypothetical protein
LSLGIPKSNFYFIEDNFSDIILEIRNGANGLQSDNGTIRKTIVFRDFSKMTCIEILDESRHEIELYWYDWYEQNQQLIMKFHAHYHPDGTPKEITVFDPFHIQTNTYRGTNENFRELNQILEFIRLRQLTLRK